MFTVLDDLKLVDSFNIKPSAGRSGIGVNGGLNQQPAQFEPVPATEEIKNAAIKYVLDVEADGATNINAAVLAGLELARSVRSGEEMDQGSASMVVFQSDGEAINGETSSSAIKINVVTSNSYLQLPIFSVAFARGADFSLLQDISAAADSFTKRVYEDSDPALQLESFYSEISSPLLSNLKFDYVGRMVDNFSLSSTALRIFFKGSQYMVVGRLQEEGSGGLKVRVTGHGSGDTYRDRDSLTICPRELPVILDYDDLLSARRL